MRVRVVGAGVIGLCCAIRLREAGVDADVVAARHGPSTTSAAAAAIWYPYRVGPLDRARSWGRATLAELHRLADDPATGVIVRDGVRHLRGVGGEPPDWAADIDGFRLVPGDGDPYAGSWTFAVPVADTTVYLDWLAARLRALGGSIDLAEVSTVDDALAGVDLAVLATGLGARSLPGDPALVGGYGQVVRVRAPGVRRWVLDEDHPDGMVYVIPRGRDVVCGGIDRTLGDGTLFDVPPPDEDEAAAILRRCTDVVPELAGAEVLGHAAGLRPIRSAVRLERDGDVIHCYGHGGAGFTLSWGCADEVRDLAVGAVPPHRR